MAENGKPAAAEQGIPLVVDDAAMMELLDGTLLKRFQETKADIEKAASDGRDSIGTEVVNAHTRLEELIERADSVAANLLSGEKDQVLVGLRQLFEGEEGIDTSMPELKMLKRKAKPQHQHFPLLLAAMRAGVPAMLHGEAGSGKSQAAINASSLLGLMFRSLSLSPTTSDTKFYGYQDAAGNYRPTGFREIYEDGGVFLFDELDNAHPSAATAINFALSNEQATFPDTTIELHKKARFVAAANTIGRGATAQYVGRAPIDAATRDRFAFIPWDIDEQLERAMVEKDFIPDNQVDISEGGIPEAKKWRELVVKYRNAFSESGIQQVCSPRATIYGVKLANAGVGMNWLKELCIYRGLPEHDRAQIDRRVAA
ncbi:MAG TPA: AAA family ATPase [Patescibacteria group bacterium]|nr:AAA family ATPase [Patescibacteria group bacterium]